MCRKVSALTEHSFLGFRGFHMVRVADFMKQWLVVGIAPSQGIELNSPMGEIDFATDQTVRPVLVYRVSAAEQVDATAFVAAADKNHHAMQRRGGIPSKAFRKGPPRRTVVTTRRGLGPVGSDVGRRGAPQGRDSGAVMALPNLALPQAIESFDGVLQTRLPRGRQDPNDAQRHTPAAGA